MKQNQYQVFTDEQTEFLIKQCEMEKSRFPIIKAFYKEFGENRSVYSLQRKISHLRSKGIVKPAQKLERNLRIGCADIEATNLKGDFGYMLCYCIQDYYSNKVYAGRITRKAQQSMEQDKDLVQKFLKDVQRFDILYFHYGEDNRFDVPFIRTRMFFNGLEKVYAKLEIETRLRDTYPIARTKLKLSSNRLGAILEALNIVTIRKTPLTRRTWLKAMNGDQKALDYVYKHCIHDVKALKAVVKKLRLVAKPKNVF